MNKGTPREQEILEGLLALQMMFITKEAFLSCAAAWESDRSRGLVDRLLAQKETSAYEMSAVRAIAESHLLRNDGEAALALARAPLNPGMIEGLLAAGPPPGLRRILEMIRPQQGSATMILGGGGSDVGIGAAGRPRSPSTDTAVAGIRPATSIVLALETMSAGLRLRLRRARGIGEEGPDPLQLAVAPESSGLDGKHRMFLALKRMEGTPLAAVLTGLEHGNEKARREWPRSRLVRLFLDICDGIGFAHAAGVMHRDLRPCHILIGASGETIVAGWGCSGGLDGSDGKLTPPLPGEDDAQRPGDPAPAYVAPEELESGIATKDARGDIFSLGVILYEILTLHLPWPGNTAAEVLANIRSRALKPPSSIAAEVPGPIDLICRKALSLNPSGRYTDARELGALVRMFLASIEKREHLPEVVEPRAKPAKEQEDLPEWNVVENEDEGAGKTELRDEGTLSVRAEAFHCRCLIDGRGFPPSELVHLGYNPLSGGSESGRADAQGITAFKRAVAMRLKAHGAACKPDALAGVDVWAFRFEETDGLLRPMTPDCGAAGAPGVPDAVIRELYPGESPFKPQGPGFHLGRTPVESVSLPAGSWLLVVAGGDRRAVRAPVVVTRARRVEQVVTLYEPPELPGGFVQIPGGEFTYQGDPANQHSGPRELRAVGEYFISRHPVTCAAYAVWLNDLARTDPSLAVPHAPRGPEGPYWPGPPWSVPTAAWLAQAPPEQRARARRLAGTAADWEESWPVLGVSWEDALAYAEWVRRRTGRLVTLPHEVEREKAARGPDRRPYPWGTTMDDQRCSNNRADPAGAHPAGIEMFPFDESPYGVRGLAGNSRDLCLNDAGAGFPHCRLLRGGHWASTGPRCLASFRSSTSQSQPSPHTGFRLLMLARPPRG